MIPIARGHWAVGGGSGNNIGSSYRRERKYYHNLHTIKLRKVVEGIHTCAIGHPALIEVHIHIHAANRLTKHKN